ncbi:hypothetical protein K493DRAFT_282725 [Basidiobolus meristosporus CBS 931.73]|uniref:OPT superfamily oligopeptide transporter n=1 Tax=Basidiobolus meristosporus CBS 931.73 TaxID=1314790 RepID=A0A1Y1YD74_9FUNG|nr:hypothetical protein K493DRAFT_282725 [Basidiobolus meristosporus CBS 931.73]|eukprot:ORX95574.1 hypothetical protein K493DRAFT_282725 [Basidiobolus meristosporus CBS 931.73]
MTSQEIASSDLKKNDKQLDKATDKIDYEEILKTEEKVISTDEKGEDPELEGIPQIVKDIVSMEDNPELPTLTFRYFVLSFIFVGLGAFVSQLTWFRTTYAPYSLFFVQICTHWAGHWMHRFLPEKEINVFGFKFNLNPGPFSIKEHVLITLSASSGATSNLGEIVVSVKDLFYHEQMHPLGAIALMVATIWTGYSFAAIARNFLIYDPELIWPAALMQTTLYRTLRSDMVMDATSKKQMKVFWMVLAGVFVWEFFPQYIFPFTSSLAVLCWFAPYNDTVSFVGSGLGGMGVLNFTLDWANITSNIMLYPWWTQVTGFVAFVISVWILVPMSYFGDLWRGREFPIMSNKLFTASGERYPFQKLMTAEMKFNETAYEEFGPVYMGTYQMWMLFFGYCTFISAFMYIGLFAGPKIWKTIKRLYNRQKRAEPDRLNKLMAAYPEVPLWWYILLFICCFVTMTVLILTQDLYLPWWTYLVGVVLGAATVVPMGYIYAISNYQVAVGTFNELIYGYLAPGTHPIGSLVYRIVAGQCWYRAQTILQDQKIGHYMHIPPRATFFSQIWGNIIGIPINYLVIRWVIDTKRPYLDGTEKDPLNQWTGQNPTSYNNSAVQYGLVGPARLFQLSMYSPLLWGFLLGVLAPIAVYLLHKKFPKLRFDLWNVTIFSSYMEVFYGNVSTGPLSQFIGGFVCMFYFFRYRHETWKKYNYLVGAAADTGYNLSLLCIFLFFSAFKTVAMPYWWGNDERSVERCFGSQ